MSETNKIQVLREAAKVSTTQNTDKIWCVIAGNEEMVNNVAYSAISAKDRVEILFREHIKLKESFIKKKFDFIMLYGENDIIRELSLICKDNGGAYIKIAPYYMEDRSNLMLLVAPEDTVKKVTGDLEKESIEFSFILKDSTTGFIETDVNITNKMPKFIKDIVDPLFKMTDVVLSTMLISTSKDNIEKIKDVAKHNQIFALEFDKIVKEK